MRPLPGALVRRDEQSVSGFALFNSPTASLARIRAHLCGDLALGIAANVVVFGVVKTLVLQPLDVPNPDRVVTFAPREHGYPVFSFPEVRDVRDSNTVFSAVAADTIDAFGMDANGTTRTVWGYIVSGQYFDVVAIKPFLGRLLQPSDDVHPGASQAMVLSWRAWKGYFDSDPKVVGKVVRVNKQPYTIVGVTPEGFYGTEKFLEPDVFLPMANHASWLESRNDKTVFPIARVKDGISLQQVQAELDTLAARMQKQNPKEEEGVAFKLATPGIIGDFLGRAVRQVILEALLISMIGGAFACALSWTVLERLAQWHPPTDYPMHFPVAPQRSLFLVAFLLATLAGVIFGAMPLRQIFNTDPNDAIKSGGQIRGKALGAARRIVGSADRAMLCDRDGCFRFATRPDQSANDGHRFQS
ncbi:MAG: hypothetical protein NVS9B15_13370 [Acidobacteriaceae bacterium]